MKLHWWLRYLLWNCTRVNIIVPYWRQVNVDSGNDLVPPRQQAIIWANVDPDLCRHMVSRGHNKLINFWLFSQHCFLSYFTVPVANMLFHPITIFTLAYLLPLSLAHLPQRKTPFKLAILYNKSFADAHPSFLLEEAMLSKMCCLLQVNHQQILMTCAPYA